MNRLTSPALLRALLLGTLGFSHQGCSGQTIDRSTPELEGATGGLGGAGGGDGGAGPGGDDGGTSLGGGGTGGGGGEWSDARPPSVAACTNPKPLIEGSDTGIFVCAEGYYHRVEAKQCPSHLPRADEIPLPVIPGTDGGTTTGMDAGPSREECKKDSDCPAANAFCTVTSSGGPSICSWPAPQQIQYWRACRQGCRVDADCGPSAICMCGTDIGHCMPISDIAGCYSDADCGGSLCLSNARPDNFAEGTFACQLPGDQCSSDRDCQNQQVAGPPYCSMTTNGRTCRGGSVCGRPFLVEHAARLACAVRSNDWAGKTDAVALEVPSDPVLASRLADHWTEIGLMEHASIAAFARFTLELLALGAPADLVRDSNSAQADETRHATLAFELASAYRGAPVGPGRLDLTGALERRSLADVLRTTIHEGCIGETRAALEAAEAARLATVPHVKATLEGIARDEGKHAALAWRVVRWLLAEHADLTPVAKREFASAFRTSPAAPSVEDATARAHGLLDAATLAHVHRAAEFEVITPCAEALFALDLAA